MDTGHHWIPNAPTDQIRTYQSWVGNLTWHSILTHPDLSSMVSFLSSANHKPLQQHIVVVCHVGKYLKPTLNQGIAFSSDDHAKVTFFLKLPFKEDPIFPLYNANWGL
eukprot:9896532-Ditylum_brightwellii.AAC.1